MSIPSSSSERGFTLVELMMAVAVIALVALLVVPRLAGVTADARTAVADHDLAVLRDALLRAASDLEGVPRVWKANPYAADADDPDDVRERSLGLKLGQLFAPTNRPAACDADSLRGLLPRQDDLVWDGVARRGWRGPYVHLNHVTNDAAGNVGVLDPWGHPFVLQVPDRRGCETNWPSAWRMRADFDPEFAERRWRFARLVSCGPNGILETPRDCFAGRGGGDAGGDVPARGDDRVLFLNRPDFREEFQ